MEFQRWLTTRYQNVLSALNDILDVDSAGRPVLEAPSSFEADTNISSLQWPETLQASYTATHRLFVELQRYYNMGVWVRENKGRLHVHWVFAQGENRRCETDVLLPEGFQLPRTIGTGVLRAPGSRVLKQLGLASAPRLRESVALMFHLSKTERWILISVLPEPWLTLHAEKTLELIQKVRADADAF